MKLSTQLRLRLAVVWFCRIAVGLTFVLSGWAKSIDISGFALKTGEYLSAWHLAVPEEAVIAFCSALAAVEFCTGILLLSGSLKRAAAYAAAAMMAVMLPLTAYIFIASPVTDCGCFGDLWHISNGATFLKNIVLSVMIVYLLRYNGSVRGFYVPAVQWLVVAVSLAFPLYLAFVGYQVQPVVDFRPYRTGSIIFTDAASVISEPEYVYEKAGERRSFALDEIPDSTWTYVAAVEGSGGSDFGGDIDVYDLEGNVCSEDIADEPGDKLILIVAESGIHYLSYAHRAEGLAAYARRTGVDFIAVIGNTGLSVEQWLDWTRPSFEVYTADATSLKQLVRGKEAVVYTRDGHIVWKRTLRSLPDGLAEADNAEALRDIEVPDSGLWHMKALLPYLLSLLIIYLLSLSPKLTNLFVRLWRKVH